MGNVLRTLAAVESHTAERRRLALDSAQLREEVMGPLGEIGAFTNDEGLRIATYYWPAPRSPKGIILLVHGQGSYLTFEYGRTVVIGGPKQYQGSWVHAMNEAGYSVAGIDHRGAGRSEGAFGLVDRFEGLVDDFCSFARTLRAPGAPRGFGRGLPAFAVACSLGGGVALAASLREPSLFDGLVLLAPMLSLESAKRAGANPVLVPISHILAAVAPGLPVVATRSNPKFPELAAEWAADACTYSFPTRLGTASQLMRACDGLVPRLGGVTVPFIAFHSENDTMTDPEGSKLLHALAKVEDKTLRLVNSMWHVLTREPGNEALLAEAIAWMDARAAPPRPAAAAPAPVLAPARAPAALRPAAAPAAAAAAAAGAAFAPAVVSRVVVAAPAAQPVAVAVTA
ncbi:hypothetical protein Rsub_04824 [Raphidocelis subcapitata]|uniref:Serine aminopeptidase S33 domain-containing protein n=1 Tax=Raphidocelis subcapitata TaxID=307507 RepID=A0A2V0P245_9CHLO|nr:hypothetical protein Rsub_04824 [Raphidocelis subcapitata]|eukprot:GBF91155.1 hypothetical protein Rsub_04824 [Raphidocelis subcapitata]